MIVLFVPNGMNSEVTNHNWRIGLLFRRGSFWVGAHYATKHKRLCINLLPCVTIWIVAPDGDVP